jgi:hypothetical protein
LRYLIFCSFEVGGLPYAMADLLNRNGVETYYLSLAKRARGHDSTQFHFGDADVPWNLSDKVPRMPWGVTPAQLRSILVNYKFDGCLATGSEAYLLAKAGIRYSYWSYGSDLDQLCFWPKLPSYPWKPKEWLRYFYYIFHINSARASMRGARAVWIAPYQYKALQAICPEKAMLFLPHFVPTVDFEILVEKKSQSRAKIRRRLGDCRILFSATRHYWGENLSRHADHKGNDIVLKAFARYLQISGNRDTRLVLVNKGPSVEKTKQLAVSLAVEDSVIWLSEMRRQELEEYYLGADFCFGQFGNPVLTFTTIEPLACGTPTASFIECKNGQQVPFYQEAPPLCNSLNPDEIASFIHLLMGDQTMESDWQRRSWQWVRSNCSERYFADQFVKEIGD